MVSGGAPATSDPRRGQGNVALSSYSRQTLSETVFNERMSGRRCLCTALDIRLHEDLDPRSLNTFHRRPQPADRTSS